MHAEKRIIRRKNEKKEREKATFIPFFFFSPLHPFEYANLNEI